VNGRAWGLAALLAFGCGPKGGTVTPTDADPPPPRGPTHQATEAASAWLSVRGEGRDREEAALDAERELAARLLGDPAWLNLYPVQLHDPEHDVGPVVSEAAGAVSVSLGLSRARAAAVMSQLEMSTPELGGPPAWRDVLYGFVAARGAAHVCERRRALFEASCEPGDLEESTIAIADLASTVSLVPTYRDGVPVDAEGRVLRAPSVFVLWNGVPVGDVPVMIEGQRIDAHVSDPAGRVALELAVGTRMASAARARIDADTLLGPLSSVWPEVVVGLAPRPITLTRWTVGVSPNTDREAGEDLQRALAKSGLGAPVEPDAKLIAAAAAAKSSDRSKALAAIADDARGAVDYVVLGDLQSAFASRMGGSRVWFEARGHLEVFEAWSGTSVVRVEAKERASGVGDARADEAARAKLVAALVASLREHPDLQWPQP